MGYAGGDVTLKEQVDDLNRRWRKFHEWEARQPPVERSAAAIIADLGAMWR